MLDALEIALPPLFGLAAFLYLGLAVFISRSSSDSIIAYFLLLIGVLVAGTAFSFGTEDPHMYGIGRVLSFFSAGFIPVAFYCVYRQYSVGPPSRLFVAILSIIPVMTTALALTNSWHQMIWAYEITADGIRFSNNSEHLWFNRVHAPFAYGLFGFSFLALASRLPGLAPAHRRPVLILLIGGSLPYGASVANSFFGVGPPDFPFLTSTLVLLLPLYAYVALSLRVFDFSPVAYETLFDHVRDPIIVLDTQQRIICANRKAEELLGHSERDLLGQRLWEDFPEAKRILEQAKELDLTQTLKLGTGQTYELSVAPLLGPGGHQQGTVVVCRDVTQRREAQARLAESEHLIRTLIETSSNGILRFARDANDPGHRFRCVFANRAAEAYLRDGNGTLVGMPLEKLDVLEPQGILEHFGAGSPKTSPVSFERPKVVDDAETWLRIVAEPVGDDISVTLIDITQRKRTEHKMMADALRDPLTGVLNRRGFEKEANARIRRESRAAVLYLDLNHFKQINDRFGHQAGDALLKAFGHRLEFCLRPEDLLGRLGGDEFAIVLPGVDVDDAKHVAERLVQTASEAYIIQGQEIRCGASVGIALMPQHGEELWHLISVADQAMYNAKSMKPDDRDGDRAAYVEAAIAS